MLKSICQECMRVEKTASYEEGKQEGIPCVWNKLVDTNTDDEFWAMGLIFCPHSKQSKEFIKALGNCLHRGAHLAVANGAMFIFEEVE